MFALRASSGVGRRISEIDRHRVPIGLVGYNGDAAVNNPSPASSEYVSERSGGGNEVLVLGAINFSVSEGQQPRA